MLAGLWRHAVRGPWGRRTHPGPGGGTPRSGADGGFTLVEVIVSISLMTITMTALTTFFVLTGSSAAHQSGSQAAAQLAQDAMDQARSLKGSAVITGRAKCGGANACAVPAAAVAPYLADIEEWDYVPAGNTPQLPTSTTATLNGLTFAENWYVGKCWQASGGGPCTQDPTNAPIVLYRVIAAVTWPEKSCPGNTCAFVTTTLISSAATSPLFNSNQTAQPPAVNNPGNQTDEKTFPVNLTMTANGGAPVVTWSATGLPPGVTLSPTGVFSGTPTTTGSYPVLVTAKDGFNLTGTAAFTWTIAPPPSVTTPAAQTADINLAITPLTVTASNGVAPYTWSATGLPPGLSISNGGTISGTPTAAGAYSVTVTVTDAKGKSVSANPFTWTVAAQLTLTAPTGNRSNQKNKAITPVTASSTGGTPTYTWSATGLPAGLTINSGTGTISGTAPNVTANYTVTVTVKDTYNVTSSTTFTWTLTP